MLNYAKSVNFLRNLGYSLALSAGLASGSYAQEEQKPVVQEKKQETQNLGTILHNYFDSDKIKSTKRVEKIELPGWVIENGIEAVMNDGTKYILDKKDDHSFVAVYENGSWTKTLAFYPDTKRVDIPQGKFTDLTETDYQHHAKLLNDFFTEKKPYLIETESPVRQETREKTVDEVLEEARAREQLRLGKKAYESNNKKDAMDHFTKAYVSFVRAENLETKDQLFAEDIEDVKQLTALAAYGERIPIPQQRHAVDSYLESQAQVKSEKEPNVPFVPEPVQDAPVASKGSAVLEKLSSCGCAGKKESNDDYLRMRAGMQQKNSGTLFRADGKFMLGDETSLSIDGAYQNQKGTEGNADLDKQEYSLIARLATGNLNIWANGSQIERELSRTSMSSSQPSPTLTQDTIRDETTNSDSQLLALKLDYLVEDNFMLRGKMYNILRNDDILVAQQDHIQGTVFVPGFGNVPVNDLILTNTESKTRTRERGAGFGFEWWLDKNVSIMLMPEYQAFTQRVTQNGLSVLEYDQQSWRIPARFQFAELVLHPQFRQNKDPLLKDEWSGWAHYTAAFPSTVAFNVGVGVAENHHLHEERVDRAYFAATLAFRRAGFTVKEVEALRAYRDLVFDIEHDLAYTPEQRKRVKVDAFEELVTNTGAFVIDGGRMQMDTRQLHYVHVGAAMNDWLTVLAGYEGARQYRGWDLGARANFLGMRVGPHITFSNDELTDKESLEVMLSVSIGK